MVSPHRGRLRVEGVVDKDFWWALRHWRRCVGQRVTRRWRGRAGQGAVDGWAIVDQRSWLVPGKRRGQSGRDGWRAVTPGAQLKQTDGSLNMSLFFSQCWIEPVDLNNVTGTCMFSDWSCSALTFASDMVSFLLGGNGGGFSRSSPSWWRLPQDTDWNSEKHKTKKTKYTQ